MFMMVSMSSLAQTTLTPNIGLQLPAYGSTSWQVPFYYDMDRLDLLLSGNLALTSLNLSGTLTGVNAVFSQTVESNYLEANNLTSGMCVKETS